MLDALRPPKFLLQFNFTDDMAAASPTQLSCAINGEPAGTQSFSGPNEHLFEADLPASVDQADAF